MGEFIDKIQIVILAAGHGKRMNSNGLPKVLIPLQGKPIIMHLLEAIKLSGVCQRPVIVVGQQAEQVMSALGTDYTYVFQSEQLGTGDAVKCTQAQLQGRADNIMILYGDHPLISSETINKLSKIHVEEKNILTMAVAKVDDFNEWRRSFYDFGRVMVDKNSVKEIIEKKDATQEQLDSIKIINPAYFCFKAEWLWKSLSRLKNKNNQKEYYLTDLVAMAYKEGNMVQVVPIDSKEAFGVNTKEQLEVLSKLLG